MNKSTTIQIRTNPRVKKHAQKILDKLDLSMSDAINLFLTQVSLQKGLPFEIKVPNKLTEDTLLKAETGMDLHEAKNIKQLFKGLTR